MQHFNIFNYNIYKDIISAGVETGETKITKEVAGKKYTFDILDEYNIKVSVTNKNGHELKFRFDDETVIMNDGKNKYQFFEEKDKYKLIMMNKDINSCNVGDISYYRIPYYKSNNQAEVSYKMPTYMDVTACGDVDPTIIKFDTCDFFSDLKSYHSKKYLNG